MINDITNIAEAKQLYWEVLIIKLSPSYTVDEANNVNQPTTISDIKILINVTYGGYWSEESTYFSIGLATILFLWRNDRDTGVHYIVAKYVKINLAGKVHVVFVKWSITHKIYNRIFCLFLILQVYIKYL